MPREINSLVADARRRLRAAGIPQEEADLDARLLAQHVLGWDAARLLTHGDEPAPPALLDHYDPLVQRRASREPIAYIVGSREFWNLSIEVTPAVLVPRPETELLVETALERFDHRHRLRVLDVCTGSGCVAVAIGREFPDAALVASDISPAALRVARRNLARHGLSKRARCVCTDLVAGIAGPFDLVTANPPYVPTVDAPRLQPEVRRYEPATALFAGEDGLDIIRRLAHDAAAVLDADGLFVFEFGAGQDEEIARIFDAAPSLRLVEIKRDLQDIPRAALVERRNA